MSVPSKDLDFKHHLLWTFFLCSGSKSERCLFILLILMELLTSLFKPVFSINVTHVHSFKAFIYIQAHAAHVHVFLLPVHVYTTDIVQRCLKKYLAKIKNKFVSPYPTTPVKIGQLNFFYWKFAVTFFLSFRFAQNLFCWKFRILDSFCQKIDIFALPSTSLLSKKKKAYLPTHFQNCGSGKGKQKYF